MKKIKLPNEFVNEAEFKNINRAEHAIKLAIKDAEKKSRLKVNRDKPPVYDPKSLNKIMLSKVLGRGRLDREHEDAWERLKKEYDLKESVNEADSDWPLENKKWEKLWNDSQTAPNTNTERKHMRWIVTNAKKYGLDPDRVDKLIGDWDGWAWKRHNGGFEDWMDGKLSESVTEAQIQDLSFKSLLGLGAKATVKLGEDKLLQLSDALDAIGSEHADDVASHLNMAIELIQEREPKEAQPHIKKFQKACKEALKKLDESVTEAKMDKEFAAIAASVKKHDLLMKISNELFPKIAKEQKDGELVNFKPLSQEQRDQVYSEFTKRVTDALKESVVTEAKGWNAVAKVMDAALKKAKVSLSYAKDYAKSLEGMAKRDAKQFFAEYGDMTEDDFIEDVEYNMRNESVTEAKFDKKKLMKAMKKDDGMITVDKGIQYIVYKYDNGNDDNDDMWQDDVIFALDQDGEEHEIKYSDIESYSESVVNESFVSFANSLNEKWNFSEAEVKAAAEQLAKAMANTDKVKVEVHDIEYDKGKGAGFELSWDGDKHDGGSYYIKDNGDVINAAISGGTKYGTITSTQRDFEKGIRATSKVRNESKVTEATEVRYKKGDKIEYQLTHKGGVGKYTDAMSKSKNTESGVIKKRIKGFGGTYKYLLTSGLELYASEIIGLWVRRDESAITERKIQTKRKYTENHPAKTVGKDARIRNKILEVLKDGKMNQASFDKLVKELSSDNKRWMKRNGKMFNVSEDGISLSRFGQKILKGIVVNESFKSFTDSLDE